MHPRRVHQRQAPIGCLIDDILEIIFDIHVTRVYNEETKNAKNVLKLTHVCGWWRDVALACPQLWSNIQVCQPCLAREFLSRRGPSGPISLVSSAGQLLPMIQEFESLLLCKERI